MLQMPNFSADGQKIVTVGVASTGKTLYEFDRLSGRVSQLIPLQFQEILKPTYAGDQLVFKAHFNGIDNLYRLAPGTRQIFQLTSAPFAAVNPSFDARSKRILFNNYSPQGYNIASIPFTGAEGIAMTTAAQAVVNYADPLIEKESGAVLDSLPAKTYASKRYRELNNLFYFHSIFPLLENNQFLDDSNYGLLLQSDNKLNTLSFYTAYQFNNALRKSEYEAGFTYSRFFPIVNVAYVNRARLLNRRIISGGKTVVIPISWREHEYKADLTIPLVANQFNNTYNATFKIGTSYNEKYAIENNYPGLIQTLKFPMIYELSVARNSRRSARDLAPRWGQRVSVRYRNSPFDKQRDGNLFSVRSNFYFPGLARNHSFQASYNFQNEAGIYSTIIEIPRVSGYSFMQPTGNTRNTLFLDYRLPLFYPDWELGPLAYIKRFKAGIFADFENIDSGRKAFSPRSFGAELRADMNLLRFPLPNFDVGGRIIFLNNQNTIPRQNPIFETVLIYNL
jgi:hypothetical protein